MKLYRYNVINGEGEALRPVLLGRRDDAKAAAKVKHRLGTLAPFAKIEPVGYTEQRGAK